MTVSNRYKPDIEEGRRRVEAWWNHELLDRVPIQIRTLKPGHASSEEQRGERPAEAEEKDPESACTDPAIVIPASKRNLADRFHGGEAFPVMYPVSTGMVAITGNYLGCPLHLAGGTGWSDPIVDDWESRPAFRFDPANKWWRITEQLLTAAAAETDGYLIGIPDLNGPTQILAQLRSTDRLLLDFYDNPEYIKPALRELNEAWFKYWTECTNIAKTSGAYFNWMGIWSDLPFTDLQSDVSCMISSGLFDEYFLPFIGEQTSMVERTVYHLDGEGALRHLDSLLDLPKLTAIQWVAGDGAAPAIEWIPVLKKIQDAGKLVFLGCKKHEVRGLIEELDPSALLLAVYDASSREEAEALLEQAEKWSKPAIRS